MLKIVTFFDKSCTQKLSYSNFVAILLPTEDCDLRASVAQTEIISSIAPSEKLPPSVESNLTTLLIKEMEIQKKCESSFKDLTQRKDFTVTKCFAEIDKLHTNFINYDALDYFLEIAGENHSSDIITAFFRRFDFDCDGQIDYKEFTTGFLTSPYSAQTSASTGTPLKQSKKDDKVMTPTIFSPSYMQKHKITPSKATDDKISIALKHQINLERELELHKENLAMKSDFNLFDGFRLFDINGKGWVDLSEFKTGFSLFKILVQTEDLMLFFRRYDKDIDGRIKYSDFCEAFTPKQKEYASILNNRMPSSFKYSKPLIQYFSDDTNYSIAAVLSQHIKCEQASEDLRQKLAVNQTFNIHDAFQNCDMKGIGYITKDDFQNYLEENGFVGTQKDYEMLMGKYDKDKDGKVSYTEFVNELTPKSPLKK